MYNSKTLLLSFYYDFSTNHIFYDYLFLFFISSKFEYYEFFGKINIGFPFNIGNFSLILSSAYFIGGTYYSVSTEHSWMHYILNLSLIFIDLSISTYSNICNSLSLYCFLQFWIFLLVISIFLRGSFLWNLGIFILFFYISINGQLTFSDNWANNFFYSFPILSTMSWD